MLTFKRRAPFEKMCQDLFETSLNYGSRRKDANQNLGNPTSFQQTSQCQTFSNSIGYFQKQNICTEKNTSRFFVKFQSSFSKQRIRRGNKMPTRCNRGFYCRSYCLLNMFRASLCPSSGAQEYYTVAAACGILCCGFFK